MILVTGFQPFLGEKINPTEKLVEELRAWKKSSRSSEFADFETLILPVSYEQAPKIFSEAIEKSRPQKVLMMGQAGGRSVIRLERVALNWQESTVKDETGFQPPATMIEPQLPAAYFSEIDLNLLNHRLLSQGLPSEISFSAGAFVCNRLYFEFFRRHQNASGFFAHFPFLPEQILGKTGKEALAWDFQVKAFAEILHFLKKS